MHYVNIPTDITHTHTHTTGVQLPECSEQALRSEGTQSKEGSPVLPVRVGESELTWGKAMSASSQRGRAIFHPPPPTGLTSSAQPLACPHHSDTLPQRVRNPPARASSSCPTVVDISVTVPSCSFGFPPTPRSEEGFPRPPHLCIKAPSSLDLCSWH